MLTCTSSSCPLPSFGEVEEAVGEVRVGAEGGDVIRILDCWALLEEEGGDLREAAFAALRLRDGKASGF